MPRSTLRSLRFGSLLASVIAVACTWAVPGVARAQEICRCEVETTVLPADGAREVPRNTKIWTVNNWRSGGDLAVGDQRTLLQGELMAGGLQRYDLPTLGARRAVAFASEDLRAKTSFTTSDELDLTPPSPPRVTSFAISQVDSSMPWTGVKPRDYPVTDLALDAVFDRDTALLRVDLIRPDGSRSSMITTIDGVHRLGKPMCEAPNLDVSIGELVVVELRAIDLAGNESEPVRIQAPVTPGTSAHGCAREHWRCGMGDMGLFILVIFVGAVVLLSILVLGMYRLVRPTTPKLGEPVAISLLVVEQIARTIQRRGGAMAVLALVGVPGMIWADHEVVAILMMILACAGIRSYVVARGVLWRVEGGDGVAAAAVHGTTVYLRGETSETELEVSARIIARARNQAVPTSIVKPTQGG